jgi:transcription factor-like protein
MTSLSCLPPRHVADFLVSIFFKYAETNYFYVDRSWLEAALNMAYGNPSFLTGKDAGTVCSILMIFAIGTQYAYLDSEDPNRVAQAKAKSKAKALERSGFSEDDVGRMFFQQASKLIPDVITVASLESVQACLLIGLYTLPLDTSGLSYVYLNLAVKLGIQNGMHRKYVGDGFDTKTIETRNRVWWTAFTVERRVCIFHGRPISVLSSDVDANEPVDRPEMKSSTGPSLITNILASIKLARFLEDLANEVYVQVLQDI